MTTALRTRFPVRPGAYALALGAPAIMLDGMEVLFDRTAGFYPVRLAKPPEQPAAKPKPKAMSRHRARRTNGNGRHG